MIENLLSFSAWQTTSVGLEASEFRLRPLVKQVLENQQLTLLSQRVRLDVHVEDVTLVADRGKIRLILENLVSNAVKYSPKGGTIHLWRAPRRRSWCWTWPTAGRAFRPRTARTSSKPSTPARAARGTA